MRSPTHLAAALVACAAASCVEVMRSPGVMFATSPPGARVIIDGKDSGFVTPCHLDLAAERLDVDLVLEGFLPASVRFDERGETWLVLWDEAWISETTWRFPLWLNSRDFFFPIKLERGYQPERVHVKLRLIETQERGRRSGAR